MMELWSSAWQGLRRRRARTALTVASVAIGTAMVALVSGIGALGETAVGKELESMGVNGLSVSASNGLDGECLTAIRQLSAVEQAMPLVLDYASARFPAGERYGVVSCGIDAGADQLISLELLHGRLLERGDVEREGAVCLVDSALALEAYGRENVVGKSLTVMLGTQRLELTVVGVTATGSSLLKAVTAMIPYMVYLPYTTLQAASGDTTIDQIAVRVEPGGSATAERAIRRTLSGQQGISSVKTEDLAAQRERLERLTGVISLALTAIGGVSLLVSGFGMLTAMLSSVHERTGEIGIKKAVGAGRGRILAEFLAGAVLMSLLGGGIGLAVGGGVLLAACGWLGLAFPAVATRWGGILLLTVVLGAAFGAYPAYRAAGARPVEALRREL